MSIWLGPTYPVQPSSFIYGWTEDLASVIRRLIISLAIGVVGNRVAVAYKRPAI